MAEHIKISTEYLAGASGSIHALSRSLETVRQRLSGLSVTQGSGAELRLARRGVTLASVGASVRLGTVQQTLNQCSAALNQLATRSARLSSHMKDAASAFGEAESALAKTIGEGGKPKESDPILLQVLKDDWGISGALLKGASTITGSILGIGVGAMVEGELLGGSIETSTKWKFDFKDKNFYAEKKIEAKGHLASGTISGNIGYLSGTATASIGVVEAAGKIGASLFKDGKFAPSVYAKLEANAAVAEGEIETKFGTDEYNAHAKAEGTLLGAEAEAKFEAGKISYTDKHGVERTRYGVAATAGAEAYVAEGKVSGGFTILGVKFDMSASGKVGGAGATAGASATTGGASGKIGLGLGVGLGLEFNVDWSDFSLW